MAYQHVASVKLDKYISDCWHMSDFTIEETDEYIVVDSNGWALDTLDLDTIYEYGLQYCGDISGGYVFKVLEVDRG